MAAFLTGLKDLGLECLENTDIFGEKKQEVKQSEKTEKPVADIPKEEDLLYEKTLECPCCGKRFRTKVYKTGKAKLLSTDMDLRPVYEGIDVTKYDVIQCEYCGYAALPKYFPYLTQAQRKLIQENICRKVQLKPYEGGVYSYDEAMQRYKLSLVNAVVKHAKNSEKAFVCLKTAWLVRGYRLEQEGMEKVDAAKVEELQSMENENLQNAYQGFVEARKTETFPICGMDVYSLDYLLAALALETKAYDDSARLVSGLLTSTSANRRIKDKALMIKEQLQAARKAE